MRQELEEVRNALETLEAFPLESMNDFQVWTASERVQQILRLLDSQINHFTSKFTDKSLMRRENIDNQDLFKFVRNKTKSLVERIDKIINRRKDEN